MPSSVKTFTFAVADLSSSAVARFAIDAARVGEAGAAGLKTAAPGFGGKGLMRLFRFQFVNGATSERSALIGQGETATEAWSDAQKLTRETFRPKNDGRQRPSNGVGVVLANGRSVARSLESFEGDETYEQERRRVRLEEERARLAAGGKVA